MVTHFRVGTNRLTRRLNLHVSSISPLPKSYSDAFNDPNCQNDMSDEYNALIKNDTWTLVPRPTYANIVRCMWLFRHNYLADGTLSRYKDPLVANGSTQVKGIDVDETFSPVDKSNTIWTVRKVSLWAEASLSGLVSAILERAHMVNCNPSQTPVDTESKLGDDGDSASNPTLYQSLAGSLQYLTFTRFDISYAVQQICLYMHDPREPHFSALKRILSTLDYGLQFFSSSTTSLVAYSDTDWVGFLTTRRSTSEAEYRGVANVVAETCWLRNLLPPLALFEEFCASLSVWCPPAQTAGEC
ncbi:ribonuclease H-like domain-containing protein [Tanacetum coccineum]